MTFVPAEVVKPAVPAISRSLNTPSAVGLVEGPEGFETDVCAWPRPGTLLPAMEALPTVDRGLALAAWDIVDEWGDQSFPASDPPANW